MTTTPPPAKPADDQPHAVPPPQPSPQPAPPPVPDTAPGSMAADDRPLVFAAVGDGTYLYRHTKPSAPAAVNASSIGTIDGSSSASSKKARLGNGRAKAAMKSHAPPR